MGRRQGCPALVTTCLGQKVSRHPTEHRLCHEAATCKLDSLGLRWVSFGVKMHVLKILSHTVENFQPSS